MCSKPHNSQVICLGNEAPICASAALASGESTVLAQGNDFYFSPRMSPDGSRLAWVAYDHPNMPWDDTKVWVADIAEDGLLTNKKLVRSYQVSCWPISFHTFCVGCRLFLSHHWGGSRHALCTSAGLLGCVEGVNP